MNNTIEKLEEYLKLKDINNKIIGHYLPDIRYFDGTMSFGDVSGNYKADSLEESLNLFLNSLKS